MAYSFFSILGYIVTIYSLGIGFILVMRKDLANLGHRCFRITAMQVGTAIGRPAVGVLSDHFGRMTIASLLTASNVVLTYAIWIPTHSYGLLIFFALVIGATSGIYWGVSI